MRVFRFVIIATLLALLAPTTVLGQDRQPATVTSVVDGDTIKVRLDGGQTLTVRLIGMDTPETHHPTKPVQCYGPEAAARTAELLPLGTTVGLERDVQELDRYGRTLAYVWTADGATMINEQLVAEGYAVVLTIPPDVRYVDRFVAAQQGARDTGVGLWTGCMDGPQEASDDAPASDDQPAAAPPAPTPPPAPKPQNQPAATGDGCSPSYPDFCIPPPPPDLNCTSPSIVGHTNFTVLPPDPHHFDADHDGVGCESSRR